MASTKMATQQVVIGIMPMLFSIFILTYFAEIGGFLETLFPTGISSIIIGWLGLKLFRIGRKQALRKRQAREEIRSA